MKRKSVMQMMAMAALSGACVAAWAQQPAPRTDPGQREYLDNCAVCHGRDGKGLGPYVEWLKRAPPDLTTMSKRNGGVFPLAQAYSVIEGASVGHGTREMPIWGREYSIRAGEYYADMPYSQEAYVRARILALAEYMSRLQVK